MKKRNVVIVGAVLVAAVLVLSGCGKSPKALGTEYRKLVQQAEALDAGVTESDPRYIKLMVQLADLQEQAEKFSEKDTEKMQAAYAALEAKGSGKASGKAAAPAKKATNHGQQGGGLQV
jgi:hypothetical protein